MQKTSLTPKDIETIELIAYKISDDICISIARSFERLEERMDAMESRLTMRLAELEDRIADTEEKLFFNIQETQKQIDGLKSIIEDTSE